MIEIRLGGDDALQLMVAIDSADCSLSAMPPLRQGLSQGEIDHAQIMLRKLRAQLLQARAAYISSILSKEKSV